MCRSAIVVVNLFVLYMMMAWLFSDVSLVYTYTLLCTDVCTVYLFLLNVSAWA